MSTQNYSRQKFAEPRGWALKWVFSQETACAPAGQEISSDNGTCSKFVEPRAWAMKWDGSALSEAVERRNGNDSPRVVPRA